MLKFHLFISGLLSFLSISSFAQIDEVKIHFAIDSTQNEGTTLKVKQNFTLEPQAKAFHFYAWVNAYRPNSVLSEIKLMSRDDKLNFSKVKDRGGIKNLRFFDDKNQEIPFQYVNSELIKVSANADTRTNITAIYDLKVPRDIFTGYGWNSNGNIYLKYLFLQPAVYENGQVLEQFFKDFESLTANQTNYTLSFIKPKGTQVFTNLTKIDDETYLGHEQAFFEVAIHPEEQFKVIKTKSSEIIIGFPIDSADLPQMTQHLERQISFLNQFFEPLKEPVFTTRRLAEKIGYNYVDDVKIPLLGKYKIFDDDTRMALQILPVLFSAYTERSIHVNNRTNHWIKNGLSTYLQIRFLEKYYPHLPIAGNLLRDIHLFQFYPLDFFKASKIEFKDRFYFFYKNSLQENYDQPLTTPYDLLGNENQRVVSYYKSGLAFKYLEEYIGKEKMDELLKAFLNIRFNKLLEPQEIQSFFEAYTHRDLSWFFEDLIHTNKKIDFAISSVKREGGKLKLHVDNNSEYSGPFRLNGYNQNDEKIYTEWFRSPQKYLSLSIADSGITKFSLNDDLPLPEYNYARNFYDTKHLLNRKIKWGILTDIKTPQYQQIFVTPSVNFNNYDKFKLGFNFSNETLMSQAFEFDVHPEYSFGTTKLTGGTQATYNMFPNGGTVRKWSFWGGLQYNHFDKNLAYFKYNLGSLLLFRSPFRSLNRHHLILNFNDIRRNLPQNPTPIQRELKHYRLLNIGYDYWNFHIIHERRANFFVQGSNKFQKLFGEFYYRYRFSKNKRLGVRLFAGIFLNHNLKETTFYDFGLDHVSDYLYRFNLLGRSDTDGIFHQQFVLAEGGFKSNFNVTANQYLSTLNFEYPIWRWFEAYADAGVYKNRQEPSSFVYNTGLSIKIIPDFFELYFPVQSSLGFEPILPGNYFKRIRFKLNLDWAKVKEYRRRGRYE